MLMAPASSPPPPPPSQRWPSLVLPPAGPSLDWRLKIGVLGGSISWGATLKKNRVAERYSTLLARELNATVTNRAVPSTGVSTPSLCLEMVMPQWRSLDVVVIEYNFNDALSSTPIATAGGVGLSALESMERLLRVLLSQHERRHPPLVIVLAVCEHQGRCETLFRDVTSYYMPTGCVVGRSIWGMHPIQGHPFFNHSMPGHWHPTPWGHAALATLLARTIRSLRPRWTSGSMPEPRVPPHLPPLRWQPSRSAVKGDLAWKCLACSYSDQTCPGLKPAEAIGFMLHTVTSNEGRGHAKPGWRAVADGSSLVVALGAAKVPRMIVLEALCSYENVGSAVARLEVARYNGGGDGETTPDRPPFNRQHNATRFTAATTRVDFRWNASSSQHCLRFIGRAPSHDEVWLHLNVTSKEGGTRGANQVKVYGVLVQEEIK